MEDKEIKGMNDKACKLLGIKPIKKEISNGVDFTGRYVEVYPNLFNPSNFIKLIELQVSKKLIIGRYFQGSGDYGVPFSNQWYDRKGFFNILIDYLSRTDECFARRKNQIIKKVQQIMWEN